MASTALQLVGFVLGVLSWIGMIVTCASPEWRQTSHGKTLIDDTIRYDGLWAQCRAFSTGQTHCSVYSKFFIGLPGVLQVCRALMITSITLGFIAVVVTILGIKCTSIGNTNPRAKARAAMIGGLLFLVSGLQTGIAASLFAGCISTRCFDHMQISGIFQTNFDLGLAIYIGWITMTSSLSAATLLIVYDDYWQGPSRTIDLVHIRKTDRYNAKMYDLEANGTMGVYKRNTSVKLQSTSPGSVRSDQSTISYPSTRTSNFTMRTKLLNIPPFGDNWKTLVYNTATDSNTLTNSDDQQSTKTSWKDSISTAKKVKPLATTHL
uniref:claudin-7-like isoform X2 n=1 Tax=Styela clava TaxID=7725 RepID=UPI001939F029|nr:claudin-7-like isoform X2 [Styela clava]